jgi:hypothetical protein
MYNIWPNLSLNWYTAAPILILPADTPCILQSTNKTRTLTLMPVQITHRFVFEYIWARNEEISRSQNAEWLDTHLNTWGYRWRLVSTQENYPWIGTDKKIILCLVSSGVELMTLTQNWKISCPFQSTDNFPEWKLDFRIVKLYTSCKDLGRT